jgi:hypothetical protein
VTQIREALRKELTARGFEVASDTVSARGELYTRGAGDLASAIFEFKDTANDAIATMYHGYGSVSADPASYSSATADRYAYWDTKLNW